MKDLLRTGNTLSTKPTNFNAAHLSEEQISNMRNLTKATFKGYVHLANPNKESKSDSLINKIAKFLKFI